MWNIVIQSMQANKMVREQCNEGFSLDYWEQYYDRMWSVDDCVVINVFYVEE